MNDAGSMERPAAVPRGFSVNGRCEPDPGTPRSRVSTTPLTSESVLFSSSVRTANAPPSHDAVTAATATGAASSSLVNLRALQLSFFWAARPHIPGSGASMYCAEAESASESSPFAVLRRVTLPMMSATSISSRPTGSVTFSPESVQSHIAITQLSFLSA